MEYKIKIKELINIKGQCASFDIDANAINLTESSRLRLASSINEIRQTKYDVEDNNNLTKKRDENGGKE